MTTQIRNLALELHPYGEIIAGALVAAGMAVAGWLVRLAMGETLRGIHESLGNLQKSVEGLTHEVKTAQERISTHDSRLAVVEDRFSRMDG